MIDAFNVLWDLCLLIIKVKIFIIVLRLLVAFISNDFFEFRHEIKSDKFDMYE